MVATHSFGRLAAGAASRKHLDKTMASTSTQGTGAEGSRAKVGGLANLQSSSLAEHLESDAMPLADNSSDQLTPGGAEASAGSPTSEKTRDEDTQEDEDPGLNGSVDLLRQAGSTGSALAKRKTAAMLQRMSNKDASSLPTLAQGVEQLLNMDIQRLKRTRTDTSETGDTERRPSRRGRHDDFNASSLIGNIFMRVQGTKAPAPLVYFDDDIYHPQWFKESIDGVQPVISTEDFDPELVNLESMGKLVDGNVLPATLGEVAAFFSQVLGDPRTHREMAPRVLIAIQCDRAKGWFTYKRDHDNSNFVPVVLCAAENGRGLEEVSPAHFEVHRAQCAQKKWRQSFKVLGAQKLHKVTSLAQAALGDVLRHLERVLGNTSADKVTPSLPDTNGSAAANARMSTGAHVFRQPSDTLGDLMLERMGSGPGVVGRATTGLDTNTVVGRLTPEEARRVSGGVAQVPNNLPPTARVASGPGPARATGLLPGARPMTGGPTSRFVAGAKPTAVPRRHTDDPNARPNDMARGLDLLATAASTAITSPRAGVPQAALVAALGGISLNELLQLVVDNNMRRQQHTQQQQLIQQLAQLQQQALQAEKLEAAAAVAAQAIANGGKVEADKPAPTAATVTANTSVEADSNAKPANAIAAAADASQPDKPAEKGKAAGPKAIVPPPALSPSEQQAIAIIMQNVKGPNVTNAVRGILQHVAMQHVAEMPTYPQTVTPLTLALVQQACNEGAITVPAAVPTEPANTAPEYANRTAEPIIGDDGTDAMALGGDDTGQLTGHHHQPISALLHHDVHSQPSLQDAVTDDLLGDDGMDMDPAASLLVDPETNK